MSWFRVTKWNHAAVALADRHYSRQSPGSDQFMPPGRTLVLITQNGDAVWGACENLDPAGGVRWRCTIFRNESPRLSSDLIIEATERTVAFWAREHGVPAVPLTTEIDPAKTRRKRDPGRCFRRAAWTDIGVARGLLVMRAPTLAWLPRAEQLVLA